MKLKKLLCLTLTTTIAFTATLSSSSSIFAEDIQETEESQCFGSLILEKMKNDYENSNDDTISVGNSNNNSSEISPMWTGSVHDEIIFNNNFNYFPEKYEDLVMKICRWCDDTSRIPSTTCLHANRNYVATIKFLWTFAKKISVDNGQSCSAQSSKAKKDCLAMFSKTKFDNRNADKKDYVELVNLANTAEYVINNYGKTKTGNERKYLIYGLIMHVIGDLTAHRTIVPKFLFDRATDSNYVNSKNRFDKSDFTSTEWSKLLSSYNNGSLDFAEIKNCVAKSKNSKMLSRYEDNPKVVPNRVLAAETMAEYFMHYFSKGFLITIFDIPYYNVDLIYYDSKYKLQI